MYVCTYSVCFICTYLSTNIVPDNNGGGSSSGLSAGATAGIVVGVIVAVGVVITISIILFCLYQQSRNKDGKYK